MLAQLQNKAQTQSHMFFFLFSHSYWSSALGCPRQSSSVAANSAVLVSMSCLRHILVSSAFAATLPLYFRVLVYIVFSCSLTLSLLSFCYLLSAAFYLLFIISVFSQFLFILTLVLQATLLLSYFSWA